MTRVALTLPEMLLGAIAGVMRHVENVKLGRDTRRFDGRNPWVAHIEGALAEMALAKHLRLYWEGKGVINGKDVGGKFQVRSTDRASGCLILYKGKDDPDDVFWLLTGEFGTYDIRGWIRGGDGMRPELWQEEPEVKSASWWIPQQMLRQDAPA